LPDHVLIEGGQNETATVWSTTGTEVFGGVRPVAVVVGEILPSPDVPAGDNPDGAGRLMHCAVGVTGMVDEARFVRQRFAVNINALIQLEDIHILLC